jgi:hypothetical protein
MNTFRVTLDDHVSIWTMLVNVRRRYRLRYTPGGRKAVVG